MRRIALFSVNCLALFISSLPLLAGQGLSNDGSDENVSNVVVQLAVITPLTSSSNSFGIPLLQSVTLAVEQYNLNLPDWKDKKNKNVHVKLNIFDDKSEPQTASDIIDEIADPKTGNVAIIGPTNSAVALKIEEKLEPDGKDLVAVTPLATATDLISKKHSQHRFFRANVPDKIRLSKLINDIFDTSPGTRNLILVYEQADVYGQGMLRDARQLLSQVQGFSMNRVTDIPFSRNLQDAEAEQIANDIYNTGNGLANDAVLLLGITRDAIKIIKALNKKDISSQVYFNEPDETEFKTAAEQNTDLRNVKVISVYYADSPIISGFLKKFRDHFDQIPSKAAAISFDAANLLLKSIDIAVKEGKSSSDLLSFRQRIGEILDSNRAADIDFVVPGQHNFVDGEFSHLQFFRLSYDKRGNLVPQQLPDDTPYYIKPIPTINVFISSFWPFIAVVTSIFLFSCVGSTIRQYTTKPKKTIRAALVSLTSLLIDPIIAVLMSAGALIALFIFKPDIFEIMKGSFPFSLAAASVFGALIGYLGTKAFTTVTGIFGFKGNEERTAR